MRLRLIWLGKTKDEHLRALVDEYLRRLNRFARCEVTELRESAAGADERAALDEEGKRVLGALRPDNFLIALEVEGRQWSSPELAVELEAWQARGVREAAFVIGGHWGLAAEVKERAQVRWSLSQLTLTHELARVVLVEQLYRGFTITRGLPYHK